MHNIETRPDAVSIARVSTTNGYERWYRVCVGCGDMAEIPRPKYPDTVTLHCPICVEEMAEHMAAVDSREATQRDQEFSEAVAPSSIKPESW